MSGKRVVFTFDEPSYNSLQKMSAQNYGSMAETVRESLVLNRTVLNQAKQGYNEVIVRNPDTKEERVLVIPRLQDVD